MKETRWEDAEGNSIIINDKITLEGQYWNTIKVTPGTYKCEVTKPTITADVKKYNGELLKLVETALGDGLLVNGELYKCFNMV